MEKVQTHHSCDEDEDDQLLAKRFKPSNVHLNFTNPPKNIFNSLKIPIKTEELQRPLAPITSPLNLLYPTPVPARHYSDIDKPVTKAVSDNLNDKFHKQYCSKPCFRCEECHLSLSSQTSLDIHLAGAKHAKKLKELEISKVVQNLKKEKISKLGDNEYKCKLCNVLAGSLIQVKSHIDGIKHKKKIKLYRDQKNKKCEVPLEESPTVEVITNIRPKEDIPSIPDAPSSCNSIIANKSKSVNSFFCDICGMCLNSQSQYDQHISSKKHAVRVLRTRDQINVSELTF